MDDGDSVDEVLLIHYITVEIVANINQGVFETNNFFDGFGGDAIVAEVDEWNPVRVYLREDSVEPEPYVRIIDPKTLAVMLLGYVC